MSGDEGTATGDASANATDNGDTPTVRVRGIYTTALTRLFEDRGLSVVQASPPIRDRFDDEFAVAPADAAVSTNSSRSPARAR